MKSVATVSTARPRDAKAAQPSKLDPNRRRLNWRLILAISLSLAIWAALILGAMKLFAAL